MCHPNEWAGRIQLSVSVKLSEGTLEILSGEEVDHLDFVFVQPKEEAVVTADPLAKQFSVGVKASSSAQSGGIAGGDSACCEDGLSLDSVRYDPQLLPEASREERQSYRQRSGEPFRKLSGRD